MLRLLLPPQCRSLSILPRNRAWGRSEIDLKRANDSQLLHDFQQVQLVPMLNKHAILYSPDVNASHGNLLACCGNTEKRSLMGSMIGVAPNDFVSCDECILYRHSSIRKSGKPAREKLLDTL